VRGDSVENDVLECVFGTSSHDTSQWAGIVIDGGHPPLPRGADGKTLATLKATDVVVRNSLVHDVTGDGIVLFRVRNGLLEGNVAWATGMRPAQEPQGPSNPNAIWVSGREIRKGMNSTPGSGGEAGRCSVWSRPRTCHHRR
jgi:hypothetical protein